MRKSRRESVKVKSTDDKLNVLIEQCRDAGYRVMRGNNNHIKIMREGWETPVFMSSTPSAASGRVWKNVRATINRMNKAAGLDTI